MPVPFYSERTIIEDKVTAYLAPKMTGVAVHKGITPDVKVIPLITAYAKTSRAADALGSHPYGNYIVTLEIGVFTSADDETEDTHRSRVQMVKNLMDDIDALQAMWTSPAEGMLYDLWITNNEEGQHQRKYGNLLEFTLFMMLPPSP